MCQIKHRQNVFVLPFAQHWLRGNAAAGSLYDLRPAGGFWPGGAAGQVMGNILVKRANIMRFWQRYRVFLNHIGGTVHIPRHAGSIAMVGLIAGMGCWGLVIGGHGWQALKLAGSAVGLGVDKVQISGNKRVSEIDVLQALGLDGDTSLPILNIDEAQAVLARLPWVEHVSVHKIYPDRLAVALTEKRAFAVWQKAGAVDIIDEQGQVIVPYSRAEGRGLPFFVGEGAAGAAPAFLAAMRQFPELGARARAYIRVADRRWDILLDNGLRIKLPEKEPFARLELAAAMDRRTGLFGRDIEELDLRLEDRITVALGAEAYARRLQAVAAAEKREKALKNGGRA
ncbi:cell division protein FtsQ/DivIB [Candidatus Tokpelaia sp.]|uniref:cell division protein FtsQ/DivIB n=1 Tax=Candidatus Tokpelaia sp. TaxID=2233777 RepID=UPI001239CCE6|nr:cell division protein FtsQ/DivIB [Candidatus Tokpelaia sp.]KAA6405868.1 cell division protein FtsQ/DivIB [Candidatus Tokpelaia sp.]